MDELSRDPAKRDAFLASLEDRTKDLATILVEHQALIRGLRIAIIGTIGSTKTAGDGGEIPSTRPISKISYATV
jgi:hypothetical protein